MLIPIIDWQCELKYCSHLAAKTTASPPPLGSYLLGMHKLPFPPTCTHHFGLNLLNRHGKHCFHYIIDHIAYSLLFRPPI